MGALTINRKRGEDYFTPGHNSQHSHAPDLVLLPYSHVSKKPKSSSDGLVPMKSSIERISQYPDSIPPIKREIHAPCRVCRIGFMGSLRPSASSIVEKKAESEQMGTALSSRYEQSKKDAFGVLRYVRGEKKVIDIDEDKERGEIRSEDSFAEEVEVLVDGKEDYPLREKRGILETCPQLIKKSENLNFQPSTSSAVSYLTDGKKLESMSLNRKLELLKIYDGVPVHKKLLDSAKRHDHKLRILHSEIEFHETLQSVHQLLRPVKKPEALVREPFVPLTQDEEDEVSCAFSKANQRKVLVTHENSNIEITGEVLQCLRPGAWLNDEVINLYLELLKEREKREPKKYLKCHFFNTFFYKKLIGGRGGYDYKSVKRWTAERKLGYRLFDCDKIFIPVHKEVHWCLAVINKKDEKFQYLDSLGGVDPRIMKVLARYFVDEVKDKSGLDVNVTLWKQEFVEELPNQENGYDCGIFMIKYADFYSRGIGLCFDQGHMPYFRLRTAKEILRLRAD